VELVHHKKLNKTLAIIAVNNGKTEVFELNNK
jgi:hypothetical protein